MKRTIEREARRLARWEECIDVGTVTVTRSFPCDRSYLSFTGTVRVLSLLFQYLRARTSGRRAHPGWRPGYSGGAGVRLGVRRVVPPRAPRAAAWARVIRRDRGCRPPDGWPTTCALPRAPPRRMHPRPTPRERISYDERSIPSIRSRLRPADAFEPQAKQSLEDPPPISLSRRLGQHIVRLYFRKAKPPFLPVASSRATIRRSRSAVSSVMRECASSSTLRKALERFSSMSARSWCSW